MKLTGEVEDNGINLFARLRNVTHIEISGAWMEVEDGHACFYMVSKIIAAFPELHSLYLADCLAEEEDFDEFQDHLQDDPTEYTDRNAYQPTEVISNSLRHIVCENVDPAFRKLWLSSPAIDVVEMHLCE